MTDKPRRSQSATKNNRCRACGKEISDAFQPHGAFCSARCKMQDLSKWFGESYRIASSPALSPEDADDPADG